MQLTVRVKSAQDGWFALEVLELPDLFVHTKTVHDIPAEVRTAAAASTGRDPDDFDVVVTL